MSRLPSAALGAAACLVLSAGGTAHAQTAAAAHSRLVNTLRALPDSALVFDNNEQLVVANPAFADLLGHLGIPPSPNGRDIRVHFGGPVERGRGFVLHSDDWGGEAAPSMIMPGGFRMTATLDVLEALAGGAGPALALLALGYSGWGPGQLEAEILRNDWLVCDPGPDLVFNTEDPAKWAGALRILGIDPVTLSHQAGRA